MLNGLKRFASAVIAVTIAFTFVGAFTRLNETKVYADTANTTPATTYTLSGKARIQGYGNKKGSFSGGILSLGKKGKKKNLYALTINFKNNTGYQGGIRYSVYRTKKGWSGWKTSGQKAGSSSNKYKIEAVRIELTGELAKHYSVVYSAYMQTYKGNQGWVSDGAAAGTQGEKKRLEQVRIKLVSRDQLGEQPSVSYRMYRDKYKWGSKWSKDGAVAGVNSGSYQKHEGLQMTITGSKYTGNIQYRVRGDGYSWTGWSTKNGKVGKYSKGKRIEEIEARLTGELAEHFDVYYRTRVKEKGWLGWAKNGERSGTDKYKFYIMAFQCVIVPKGADAPGNINGVTSKYTSSYLVNGNPVLKFADFKADHKTSKTMVGIDVSKYQGNIDFKKAKAAGVEFVILRCYVRNNYYDKTKKKYVWCNAPDTKFEQYYKDAKAAGLKIGLYFFTCDYTEENMRKYTQDMIKKCKLDQKQIDFPIAFDWENFDYYKRAHKSNKWSTSTMNKHIDSDLNKMVAIFEEECNKAGYSASIYGSKSRLEGTWSPSIKNMKAGKNNLSIWMAHWVSKSSYKGSYYMWQVNSHGRVPGISGDVDLDVAYIDRLPSPKAPVNPEDPSSGSTDKPEEQTEATQPKDNNVPDEEAKPEEGETPAPGPDEAAPEEGNATPEDGAKAPEGEREAAEQEEKKPDETPAEAPAEKTEPEDEPAETPSEEPTKDTAEPKEAAPSKDSGSVKENAPAKEEAPVKEAEPDKDTSSKKDAEPAKSSSKEQPEEVTTGEP